MVVGLAATNSAVRAVIASSAAIGMTVGFHVLKLFGHTLRLNSIDGQLGDISSRAEYNFDILQGRINDNKIGISNTSENILTVDESKTFNAIKITSQNLTDATIGSLSVNSGLS